MDRELGLLHLDPNVSEGVLAVEDVEAGQHHVGVRAAAEHELLRVRAELRPRPALLHLRQLLLLQL